MMEMTPVMRCEIMREIRVVFVRHFIDLGRLQYNLAGRAINVSGYLDRLPGSENRLTPQMVESIIRELKNIRMVTAVYAEFENWKQVDGAGAWHEVGFQKMASVGGGAPLDTSPHTLEIRTRTKPADEK